MDIICDTHIWYHIGDKSIDTSKIDKKHRLVGSYNNLDELSRTPNLIHNTSFTVNAIRAIFDYSKHHILIDTPFTYLKKLYNPAFTYDTSLDIEPLLEFSQRIANGDIIATDKEHDFTQMSGERKERLKQAADIMNSEALRIKKAIGKKELLKRDERIPDVRKLISYYVSIHCGDDGLPEDFDWTQIELFENVFLDLHIKLEKGAITLTPNDWYDVFLLAYVKPNDLVWTRENKWIDMIKDSGMKKYLFQEE